MGGSALMRSSQALKDGILRVWRAPVLLVSVFLVTLLTTVPMSLMMRSAIATQLGSSMTAESVSNGVNPVWWDEFTRRQSPLATSFSTTIIGFAAVLDNISTLLDRRSRPPALVWLGGCYLLLWLFLSGGILDRYARDRPTRSSQFFAASGVFFVRFLRLAPFMFVTYYVMFFVVHPLLFDDIYGELVHDVTVERTAFLWRLGLYVIFGGLLAAETVIFDYARARAVIEDRRSMIGALLSSVRFIRRNLGGVVGLYLLNCTLFVAVLVAYALVAPGARGTGLSLWAGFLISQLYLAARIFVRLVFLASEVALFQGRLAHAGYIAGGTVPSEPPIVERIVTSAQS